MNNLTSDELRETLNCIIKIGEVSTIDPEKCTARVVFDDDDSIVSGDLPILQKNTLKNKDFYMPEIGEDVFCIFLPSGVEEGFILGSFYAGEILPPDDVSKDKRITEFSDGTRFVYDRSTGKFELEIDATKITATKEKVSVETSGEVEVTAVKTSITSPFITMTGNVNVTGSLTASGDVVSGAVSLQQHLHTGNLGQPTSPPYGGGTGGGTGGSGGTGDTDTSVVDSFIEESVMPKVEDYVSENVPDMVTETLGISAAGNANKFMNEQGQFVELETGGGSGGGLTKWGEWESISADTEYTAETNGWIYVCCGSPGSATLYIDDEVVFSTTHQDDSGMTFVKTSTIIPVFAGQRYYITGDFVINCRFAPCV